MEYKKHDIKIYMLSGKSGSGKDEVGNIIANYYQDKKCINISFAYYLKDYVKRITGWDGNESTKPRELLQTLGIELIKNNINSTLLIDRVLDDIEVFSYFYDVIIITDARLIDEIEKIKEKYKSVVTIRLNRDKISNTLTPNEKKHITETGLDNYDGFDYVINNDNYDDLKKDIENILRGNSHE